MTGKRVKQNEAIKELGEIRATSRNKNQNFSSMVSARVSGTKKTKSTKHLSQASGSKTNLIKAAEDQSAKKDVYQTRDQYYISKLNRQKHRARYNSCADTKSILYNKTMPGQSIKAVSKKSVEFTPKTKGKELRNRPYSDASRTSYQQFG